MRCYCLLAACIPFQNKHISAARHFVQLFTILLRVWNVFEYLISVSVDRKVVRQEAEHGRGDPVRDRSKAEASDGPGGRQRAAEAPRLDHRVECGL